VKYLLNIWVKTYRCLFSPVLKCIFYRCAHCKSLWMRAKRLKREGYIQSCKSSCQSGSQQGERGRPWVPRCVGWLAGRLAGTISHTVWLAQSVPLPGSRIFKRLSSLPGLHGWERKIRSKRDASQIRIGCLRKLFGTWCSSTIVLHVLLYHGLFCCLYLLSHGLAEHVHTATHSLYRAAQCNHPLLYSDHGAVWDEASSRTQQH